MTAIKAILVAGVFSSFILYLRYFRSLLRDRLFAVAVLGVGVLAIIFPDWTTRLAKLVGVGRGADLISYIFFILCLFGFVAVHGRMVALERSLTLLVRHTAVAQAREKPEEDSAEGADPG